MFSRTKATPHHTLPDPCGRCCDSDPVTFPTTPPAPRKRYTWTYVSPLPWSIIVPVFFGGLFLIIFLYLEYRRRKKKRAMER